MSIQVWNLHEQLGRGPSFPPGFEYIGRPTVLGNPFVLWRDGNRQTVIGRYKREWLWPILKQGLADPAAFGPVSAAALLRLEKESAHSRRMGDSVELGGILDAALRRAAVWQEVQRLLGRLGAEGKLDLVCYCTPLACHGDVLADGLRWLMGNAARGTRNAEQGCADVCRGAAGDEPSPPRIANRQSKL